MKTSRDILTIRWSITGKGLASVMPLQGIGDPIGFRSQGVALGWYVVRFQRIRVRNIGMESDSA